jgi:uncharacterized membrane protein
VTGQRITEALQGLDDTIREIRDHVFTVRRAAVISVVLLAAVTAAFLLPWPRLPAWMPVLVPLAYTGSVLALILAAGTTSGVGIVILVALMSVRCSSDAQGSADCQLTCAGSPWRSR